MNTDVYVLDGTVPRTRLEEVLAKVYEITDRCGITVSNVFHAGDGNLHPNISYDGRDADQTRQVLAAGREILEACVAVGGTLSGEHGIGVEKKEFLQLVFSPDDLATQIAIRNAIDPRHLANPGKIFPDDAEAGARAAGEVGAAGAARCTTCTSGRRGSRGAGLYGSEGVQTGASPVEGGSDKHPVRLSAYPASIQKSCPESCSGAVFDTESPPLFQEDCRRVGTGGTWFRLR